MAEPVRAESKLAARTVALANSSTFNSSGRPITNVRSAVTRVGYRNLQMLVASLVVRQFGARIEDPALRAKAEQLWEQYQIRLLTLPRANQHTQLPPTVRRLINHVRQIIETVNGQLTEQFGIETNHAQSFWGLCARLYTKLTAHTLCLYLNRLLGNPEDSAGIEITMGGLRATAGSDLWFAVTGAWGRILLAGREADPYEAHPWHAGDELQLDWFEHGARAYLAVRGGFDARRDRTVAQAHCDHALELPRAERPSAPEDR